MFHNQTLAAKTENLPQFLALLSGIQDVAQLTLESVDTYPKDEEKMMWPGKDRGRYRAGGVLKRIMVQAL